MKDNSCIYIFILVDRDADQLEKTIDSILNQTLDQSKIRVLIGDNASDVNEYKKLLEYEIRYPELISVIHEKKATTMGRLLKHMALHLRFSAVSHSLILRPGDVIYPAFLEQGLTVFKLKYAREVVFDADVYDVGTVRHQMPVYSSNCILDILSRGEYYRRNGDHKVLILYYKFPLELNMKLPYYSVIADYYDEWFSLLINRNEIIIYIHHPLGCCIKRNKDDVVHDLIKRAFLIKRNLYAIETGVFSSSAASDIETGEVSDAYSNLSTMALHFAVDKVRKNEMKEAEDCLLFAEMMNKEIVNNELYVLINKYVTVDELGKNDVEILEEAIKEESVDPPREACCF